MDQPAAPAAAPRTASCIWPTGCTRTPAKGKTEGSGRRKEYCEQADQPGGTVHNARNRWAAQQAGRLPAAPSPGEELPAEVPGRPVATSRVRAAALLDASRSAANNALTAMGEVHARFAALRQELADLTDPAAAETELETIGAEAEQRIAEARAEAGEAERRRLAAERALAEATADRDRAHDAAAEALADAERAESAAAGLRGELAEVRRAAEQDVAEARQRVDAVAADAEQRIEVSRAENDAVVAQVREQSEVQVREAQRQAVAAQQAETGARAELERVHADLKRAHRDHAAELRRLTGAHRSEIAALKAAAATAKTAAADARKVIERLETDNAALREGLQKAQAGGSK
ncbi:hypothetical protein [Streptosporangium roseum]|uniref:hypothetical protein n=1 Tax=Streptosporangium roseum TaxID=2001 RepID=UPI00331D0308